MKKINLPINSKYGRLTTIKCLNILNNRNRIVWEFKCDCGNICQKSASDVIRKRIQSCGCLGEETKKQVGNRGIHHNTKPDKEGPFNKLYGNYKRMARKRNYIWNLSKPEFKTLISQKCYYCNRIPSSEICISEKRHLEENTLQYNGIDRKDNGIGYVIENCVTCCFWCNRMKMNISYKDFIEHIKTICKNLNL